jgi:hypothetical protein
VLSRRTGLIVPAVFFCLFSGQIRGAPPRTNPLEAGEHLIAVVPMVGLGTIDNPKRPMFALAGKDIAAAIANHQSPAISQSHFVMADDGVSAIVEFVAPNRVAFKPILAAAAGTIKVYDPTQISVAALNAALQKIKSGFNLYQFHSPMTAAAFAAQQQAGAAQ